MNRHAPARAPASHQDVLDAPEHIVAELSEGALHLHPRPAPRHSRASSTLGVEIGGPFDRGRGRGGPGGRWILDEPELHLGAEVIVPDLAGWRRERTPQIPDAAWFDVAPDSVCEVLSPGARRLDLTDKRRLYATAGVAHLWFVDPLARTLEAFELRDGARTLIAAPKDDEEVRVPPFDAIAFPLDALWAD